jgi:hypothetical protein
MAKEYKFYGWENADIKDAQGRTPRDYYDLLSDVWCLETCGPGMRDQWSPENKTAGQCSITAFAMQDIYGGKVYGMPIGLGVYHCFNVVGDCVFDLTSEQFGGKKLDYDNAKEQDRAVHFADEGKKKRYELLKKRLEERMSR